MVEPQEWRLGDVLGRRRERLLDVPTPEDLLARMSGEAEDASRGGLIQLDWESSRESPGYFRLVAQIPLDETTFDQLFNGRSGYRAQYYLSPEEGILFNRDILDSLAPAIGTAFEATPLSIEFNLVEQSLRAPRSKIWVYKDQEAFNEAVASTINPDRWVENNAVLGRRAPLPSHLMLDVKGSFILPGTRNLFVDELKLDRAWDLFRKGFT